MEYERANFIEFSTETGRVIANLESAYNQLLDASRALDALPVSMYWQNKSGTDYLAVKTASNDDGTTKGARSAATEAALENFKTDKEALKARIKSTNTLLNERASQYRALGLPPLPDRQGEILRELDQKGLLRNDVMVVGTNAFAAYELACNAKFPVGNEETEDFDLAWCRGTSVSLARIAPEQASSPRPSLISVLMGIDSTFTLNKRKPYQVVNAAGYEVELLAAPSTHPLPKNEGFDPMGSLVEQEWLLKGRPVSCVVATVRRRVCPLYVPDPRWMALHKLWLSQKPGRNPAKKPKDERQGNVLLDATRYFLADTYPMDIDFVLDLPDELRTLFNEWAKSRGFDPGNPV
jgi:hypothetical protein